MCNIHEVYNICLNILYMNRGMLMDKVLPEVVQHCLNAETAEPEALAGCGCRAEPPEMASTYM